MQISAINNNVSFRGSVQFLSKRAEMAASDDACLDVQRTLKSGLLYSKLPDYNINVSDANGNYVTTLMKNSNQQGHQIVKTVGEFKDFNVHEALKKAYMYAIADAQLEKFNPFKQGFFTRMMNIFKRV